MLDKDLEAFMDKVAAQDSVGESQVKKKVVHQTKRHGGAGAGLGATIGALAGSSLKKFKGLGIAGGALAGALAGRGIGKKTKTKTKTTYEEGTMKRKEKRDEPGKAEVPRLSDGKVLNFLKKHK